MSSRGIFIATVHANQPHCDEHYQLLIHVPNFPPTEPGQFIQLQCASASSPDADAPIDWHPGDRPAFTGSELLAPSALLRRPFSLAGRSDQNQVAELHIIHRLVGIGTGWLAALKPGDPINILGPLGNQFTLPAPNQPALLVGGGVGIPPMIYLAQKLAGHPAVAFAGATTSRLLPLTLEHPLNEHDATPRPIVTEFSRYGIPTVISTDEGSLGYPGFVTQALETYLDAHPNLQPILYTCGPEIMMKKVAAIAQQRRLHCQVAVERAMACGMGTCQSCCIRVKKPHPQLPPLPGKDWAYRLACTDGPIFSANTLLW